MTFEMPSSDDTRDLYVMSLPQRDCTVCGRHIGRRSHRVVIRASWRDVMETLCPGCWGTICQWASRFALQQAILPLGDGPSG
jgi:hypothetical protein